MNWFNLFSRTKFDDEILDLYLDIELLIGEIDKIFEDYLKYLYQSNYYKSNPKDKKFYSIQRIRYFFGKLKEEYAYCYTLREQKKRYNFRSNTARAEKSNILINLRKIKNILELIYSHIHLLDKTAISKNDFSELNKQMEAILKIDSEITNVDNTQRIFRSIKKSDESAIFEIIAKILSESEKNAKNGIWLLNQKDGKSKLFFSRNLSISEIKYLELVPLLELKGLEKRSLFINELHKDDTLPMFHYNFRIDGRNIHVVPKEYRERIERYLIAA